MKAHSRSPVSQVLAWNCSRFNPVRSEYIILEKSSGQQLTKGWDNMSEPDRVKLICRFAQMENHLANNEFPGYGALYLRHELPASLRRHPERLINVDGTYCLGPMYHGAWPGGFAAYPEEYILHSGPCEHCQSFREPLLTVLSRENCLGLGSVTCTTGHLAGQKLQDLLCGTRSALRYT